MAKKKRKRAPGGGRKCLGQSVARKLTIRIDDELRERLEVEVGKRAQRRRNWNLSQEILMRLNQSLSREQERGRDPAMRALLFLIGELAEHIIAGSDFRMKWHKNPFLFQALKLGTTKVLDSIAPPGEIESPYKVPKVSEAVANCHRTPEDAADISAFYVISRLYDPRLLAGFLDPRLLTGDISRLLAEADKYPDGMLDEVEREYYGMSAALRDLGIEVEPKL